MEPQSIDWRYLTGTTRARIYLLWAIMLPVGFVATHLHQQKSINGLWFLISVIGLWYMYRAMPMAVKQMQRIFGAWLLPIGVGMVVSGLVFYVDGTFAAQLTAHLGAFWLVVMGIGYFLNGLVDAPSRWYWFAAALNVAAGIACFVVDPLAASQYLIAAIVSAWSMLNLWLFRS